MKIYIIDCDGAMRLELNRMIEEEELGEVVGMSAGWDDACRRIAGSGPDVILADLCMPWPKTVASMRKIREMLPGTSVIMLSQSHSMEAVQKAYEGGAWLFLHKPINRTELANALRSLKTVRIMEWMMKRAGALGSGEPEWNEEEVDSPADISQSVKHLKGILQEIGIFNEAGSKDIIRIASYLMEQKLDLSEVTIRELCKGMNQNTKSVEQRIRRAAADGMYKLASRGLDDYTDPVFNAYGGRLYSFDQMKKEMNYIRGKSDKHGNVRIKHFLGGLLDCCREL